MTKPSNSQSQKRFQESIAALFSKSGDSNQNSCLFLKSSSDIGVIRNGGRNGARFAPQSLLSFFKKLAINKTMSKFVFIDEEVSNSTEEEADFHSAQDKEAQRIAHQLKTYPSSRICHIGGGHDHVYPLLIALARNHKKIIVVNIDAHADTRVDEHFHSGTPFRQFAQNFEGDFHLYQIGLHPFANSSSTLSPLGKGQSEILWKNNLNSSSLSDFFKRIEANVDESTLVLFSLDADALDGSVIPAVSAVNPNGLSRSELSDIWKLYSSLPFNHPPVMGIYELNPIYDTLSGLSMRTIASFLYETLS
jgi:formiminoglutamase